MPRNQQAQESRQTRRGRKLWNWNGKKIFEAGELINLKLVAWKLFQKFQKKMEDGGAIFIRHRAYRTSGFPIGLAAGDFRKFLKGFARFQQAL